MSNGSSTCRSRSKRSWLHHPGPSYLDKESLSKLSEDWQKDFLSQKEKQPRLVESADDFLFEVLCQNHLNEVIVLPNGVSKLGLREEDVLPVEIVEGLNKSSSVMKFLSSLDEALLSQLKGRLCYESIESPRVDQFEPKASLPLREKLVRVEEGIRQGLIEERSVYLTEFKYASSYMHPVGRERVKTLCALDIKDLLVQRFGLEGRLHCYWDRFDEGVFVGGRGSGKCLHVDQVLWSNVGKNWRGWKVVVLWGVGSPSNEVLEELGRQVFKSPLSDAALKALDKACKVVLVRPGDVFLFCGGQAHTVISVSEDLSVTGYESFVSFCPPHLELFLRSGCSSVHHWDFSMSDSELDDIDDDIVDHCADVARDLKNAVAQRPLQRKAGNEDSTSKGSRAKAQDVALRQFKAGVRLMTQRRRFFRREFVKQGVVEAVEEAESCSSRFDSELFPMQQSRRSASAVSGESKSSKRTRCEEREKR